jgi:N-acetylmuramoyl-L-alanine amidase
MYKYTVGASTNYQEIYQLRKSVLGKFPQAFIIAFRDDRKMDVNEAISEYKSKKRKR